MKNTQTLQSSKKVSGFTLLELIVVIVIIGIIGAIVNGVLGGSGVSASARATQKYDAATKLVLAWSTVSQHLNVSKNPMDSNLFANTNHDAMDVLIPQDPQAAIATEYRAKYLAAGTVRAMEQYQVITSPTSSAKGVYAIGDAKNTVTINYDPLNQVMSVIIQNVPGDEVRSLMDTIFPTNNASGTNYTTTARTTSSIQYSALSAAQTHTLTILRKV